MKFINKLFRIPTLILLIFLLVITVLNSKFIEKRKSKLVNLTYKTPPSDYDKGNIFMLESHNVECPKNSAIAGFHLTNPYKNMISYSYGCNASNVISKEFYNDTTEINETEKSKNNSANFLDRHLILCKDKYVLQRFKLNKYADKIQYNFRCVRANCGNIMDYNTNSERSGEYQTDKLISHKVRLEKNQAIVGFQLFTIFNKVLSNTFHYKIFFCNLNDSALQKSVPSRKTLEMKNLQTPLIEYGKGSIFLLQEHHIICPDDHVLTGFALKTQEKENFNYEYTCWKSTAIKKRTEKRESHSALIDEDEFKSIKTLSKLNVDCDDGYALQEFKLYKKEDSKEIFYNYNCVKVDCKNVENPISTKKTNAGDLSLIFLNNQKINLKEGKVLTGFKLNIINNENSKKIQYIIKYCQLIESPINDKILPLPEKKKKKVLLNKGDICFDPTKDEKEKICDSGLICIDQNNKASSNEKTIKKCLPVDHYIKSSLDKGNQFCESHCLIDDDSEIKNCWKGSSKSCKKCTIKPEIKELEKIKICEAICFSLISDPQCKFFGFVNKEKKDFDPSFLKKYGL